MPELPEVERVRRTLERHVIGQRVKAVQLNRGDVVHGGRCPADLLEGQTISRLDRRGKQLAIIGHAPARRRDRCICVHLGMSGSLRYYCPQSPSITGTTKGGKGAKNSTHLHVVWHFDNRAQLWFRDPRRFGGIWTFTDSRQLYEQRWGALGEDAVRITPARLHKRLASTRRPIKAALLDQNLLAGLGNIYVDELLFLAGLGPLIPANKIGRRHVDKLVGQMRRLLRRAIDAGGSTLRDYADADGRPGDFQRRFCVYGRAGEPCTRCKRSLGMITVAGRTTVFCRRCQSRSEAL